MIRPFRATSVLALAALAGLLVAGCAPAPTVSPSHPVTSPAPVSSSPAASPRAAVSSVSPVSPPATVSASPTAGPSVKATGSLELFAPTSDALTGTCGTNAGVPTLALTDKANDFFDGIDVTVRLNAAKSAVTSVAIHLGKDSEEYVRDMTYAATSPAKGTSAALKVSGRTYTVSGKLNAVETKGSKRATSLMPYVLKVTCAAGHW